MSSRTAVLLVALAAFAGCKKKTPTPAMKAGAGEDCDGRGCIEGLRCYERTCMTERELAEAEASEKAAAGEAVPWGAQRMVEASVVEPESHAEASEAAPGAAIRVVKVTERGSAFAACRSTERLVGGGCRGGDNRGPANYSADDTIGARWLCESNSWEGDVRGQATAYALCARLPDVTEAPPAAAPRGEAATPQ